MNDILNFTENNFDILCIAETKLDSSFPKCQFEVKSYRSPFRLDITDSSGGLMVYTKPSLSATRLKRFSLPEDIEVIPIEIRLKSSKWLVVSIYRNPKQDLDYFLTWLSKLLDFYSSERCVVLGDFNAEPHEISNFIDSQELYNHVKFQTCFKSAQGTCIDLILSNQKHSLQRTGYLDTGISDYHRLIYTVSKSTFVKNPPKEVVYRCYKNFSEIDYLRELSECLNFYPVGSLNYDNFELVFTSVLDKHAPWRTKIIRGNEKPHMNKVLKKEIMKRTRLWNIYYFNGRNPSDHDAYRKQRNLVTKLNKRIKRQHFKSAIQYAKGRPKDFWSFCKPFMSDKGFSDTRIVLNNPDGSIIQDKREISDIFNDYFNNITKPLNLFEWNSGYSTTDNDPVVSVVKSVLKYADHPSVLKIHSKYPNIGTFKFEKVTSSKVYEMILKLNCSKKN